MFIRRAFNPKDPWSGNVAFPGGRKDGDETDKQTAVRETMEELGLDQMFNPESWPAAPPLRELCTKVKNLTGEGFSNPFVFAELHK